MPLRNKKEETDVQTKIDRYFGYFRTQVNEIAEIRSGQNSENFGRNDLLIYKKALFVCILSSLARGLYGKEQRKDKEHFIQLIAGYADWADSDRVSSIQLFLILRKNRKIIDRAPGGLYEKLEQNVSSLITGQLYKPVEIDTTLDEYIEKYSVSEIVNVIKMIEDSRMTALLYAYRCNLIHEFRQPGYGIEMTDDGDYAYYHSYSNRDPGWELVFPLALFKNLCLSCIDNLQKYYRVQAGDPYAKYLFSSMWSDKFMPPKP